MVGVGMSEGAAVTMPLMGGTAVCAALEDDEVVALERIMGSVRLEANAMLVEEGAPRRRVFSLTSGMLRLLTALPDGRRQMPPLLHPVDRVLFMGALAHRSAFIVHSCGWSCNGRAALFPGVSGAGKTTLCRQLMAAGRGTILSDDRVVLREGPTGFRACGTPWPGDAKQARNESAPLAALGFIEQAPGHRLTPISPAEALRRLMEAASIPWYSSALRDLVLPLVERLVSTVPAYRVGFRPDPGVFDVLAPLMNPAG